MARGEVVLAIFDLEVGGTGHLLAPTRLDYTDLSEPLADCEDCAMEKRAPEAVIHDPLSQHVDALRFTVREEALPLDQGLSLLAGARSAS